MSATSKAGSVRFTTKGRVAIPAWLRREFHIGDGTKAIVQATPEGILLRPVTKHAINRLHGALRRKHGEPPFAEWWAAYKAEERALEEAKFNRHFPPSALPSQPG